jgi:hypothetical protein
MNQKLMKVGVAFFAVTLSAAAAQADGTSYSMDLAKDHFMNQSIPMSAELVQGRWTQTGIASTEPYSGYDPTGIKCRGGPLTGQPSWRLEISNQVSSELAYDPIEKSPLSVLETISFDFRQAWAFKLPSGDYSHEDATFTCRVSAAHVLTCLEVEQRVALEFQQLN